MLSIIVATSLNGGIGKDNDLLFHIREDLQRFKQLTTGHTIIMGSKTFQSFPNGALPNRKHIVLTRNTNDFAERNLGKLNKDVFACNDLTFAISYFKSLEEEVFIIGGGEIYNKFVPFCDKIYLTKIHSEKEADTFFEYNEKKWEVEKKETHNNGEYTYDFIDLIRK